MIGSDANSSGSNWSPKTKLDHYLDSSGKISQISVASLKFMIMMQMCKDSGKWEFDEILTHQKKMLSILAEGNNYQEPVNNNGNVFPNEGGDVEGNAEDRSAHIATLVTNWLTDKERDGELHLRRDKSNKRYIRFTTDDVTAIIPNAQNASSGWGTNNYYFFEVHNHAGKVNMQFALSGKKIPDDLSFICDKIDEYFPVKQKGKRWSWRLPFSTAKARIPDEMPDEEIVEIISHQYDELKQFESKLIETMSGNVM